MVKTSDFTLGIHISAIVYEQTVVIMDDVHHGSLACNTMLYHLSSVEPKT